MNQQQRDKVIEALEILGMTPAQDKKLRQVYENYISKLFEVGRLDTHEYKRLMNLRDWPEID